MHFSFCRKRLNYVNHARRLAEGDWTGADSEEEEEPEVNGKEVELEEEDEGMEIEQRKRLPRHFANQVSLHGFPPGTAFSSFSPNECRFEVGGCRWEDS